MALYWKVPHYSHFSIYETTPERMMNQMIFKWIQSQQFPSLTRSIVYNNLCLAKSSEVELGSPERISLRTVHYSAPSPWKHE